ncbi:hypothetical protein J2T02_003960 [Chitinophaga terrae (ex Kim and Jung 2007)]|uniref:hypothetical protein n=1 Tax=Chitinophaga terrae (ex Kim and Jung 2007) TaxID=408074 RepID=UPI00278AEFB5|nr:hypothetical protein [Chitinophaga terrae (ex Kim and Jung 2007)]MDQ0108820.1 hypothetical protein [Chitinophaga terrae (ex Kim and Jung 2007)]
MNKEKFVILVLSICLFVAISFVVSGFYYKPPSTSPVSMVFQGYNYSYEHEENFGESKYWNNFPYLVLMSEGKRIDTTIQISKIIGGDSLVLSSINVGNKTVFLRLPPGDVNIAYLDTIGRIVKKSRVDVKILVESVFIRQLESYRAIKVIDTNKIYLLSRPLNITIEQLGRPYLFTIDSLSRVQDVFVPRMEIMEVMNKYLHSHGDI